MVEDGTSKAEGLFVVRQGEGDKASYAICVRIETVDGSHRIAGTSKTVAELVNEQGLQAAFVDSHEHDGVRMATFEGQSGRNFSLVETPT